MYGKIFFLIAPYIKYTPTQKTYFQKIVKLKIIYYVLSFLLYCMVYRERLESYNLVVERKQGLSAATEGGKLSLFWSLFLKNTKILKLFH